MVDYTVEIDRVMAYLTDGCSRDLRWWLGTVMVGRRRLSGGLEVGKGRGLCLGMCL